MADDEACPESTDACVTNVTVGDALSCDERCEPQPEAFCKFGDGCCPEGCGPNVEAVPPLLRDDDCVSVCGNGLVEYGEQCDQNNFDGNTCETVGDFTGGTLGCTEMCQIDTSACFKCGNGVIELGETCDFGAVGGKTSADFGMAGTGLGNDVRCDLVANCQDYDLRFCTSECGNNVADPTEVCDGEDLKGRVCSDVSARYQRYEGDGLSCSETCRLDSAECIKCGVQVRFAVRMKLATMKRIHASRIHVFRSDWAGV